MPNPKDFDDKDSFLEKCIPEVEGEGKDHDQAVAQCTNMWKERDKEEDKSIHIEKMERRFLPVTELRVIKDDGGLRFDGYAAVFNKLSEDLGGFREKIKKGAFKDAIKISDTRALFNHDSNFVLGRKSSGTLKLEEDNKGLHIEIDPPDTQWTRDLATSVQREDINQMSFGFWIEEEKWDEKDENNIVRTIIKVKELPDISIVTYPAYPDTTIALRSKGKWEAEKEKPAKEKLDDPHEGLTKDFLNKFLEFAIEQKNILDKIIERFSEKDEPMQVIRKPEDDKIVQKEKDPEPMQRDRWNEADAKLKTYNNKKD